MFRKPNDQLNFSPSPPLPAIIQWIIPDATVHFALLKKSSKLTSNVVYNTDPH